MCLQKQRQPIKSITFVFILAINIRQVIIKHVFLLLCRICECYLAAFSCLRHLFLYLRWSFFPIHSVYDGRIKSSAINICLLSNRFYESPRWITEHIVLHIVTHHFQGIKCRKKQPNKLLSTHLKVIKSNCDDDDWKATSSRTNIMIQ